MTMTMRICCIWWASLVLLLGGGNWNNTDNAGPSYLNAIPITGQINNTYNTNHNIILGMPPRPKYNITKDLLMDLHLEQKLTPNQIADKLGCSHGLILHYFKKYGIKKLPKYQRIEGERFGKLVVTRFVGIGNNGAIWECTCDCGNIITATAAALNFGKVRSCGCLPVETNTSHGMSSTRPYRIWQGMKTRCSNPNAINYGIYGGRGITYDKRWETFEQFWEDMHDGYDDSLSLERVDNDQGYSKSNCIWADKRTQNFNKRSCVYLDYEGEKRTITGWAEVLQIDRAYLYYLHSTGLTDDQIIEKAKEKPCQKAP